MLLALDARSLFDVRVLKSSQALQNSMFSSQNSDLRKMQKTVLPSAEQQRDREREREKCDKAGDISTGHTSTCCSLMNVKQSKCKAVTALILLRTINYPHLAHSYRVTFETLFT